MATTRFAYAGAPLKTTITSGINAVDTAITIATATGWPTGAPFVVVIDSGQAGEEKVLVTRSGTSLTATTRGYDSTTAASHSAGAAVWVTVSSIETNSWNRYAATPTTKGDLILTDASGDPIRLAVGSNGQLFVADSTQSGGGKWDWPAPRVAADAAALTGFTGMGEGDTAYQTTDDIGYVYSGSAWVEFGRLGAWSAFTFTSITQSGSVAHTLTRSTFCRIGSLILANCKITFTAAGTAGSEIILNPTTIPSPHASITHIGNFRFLDSGTTLYTGAVQVQAGWRLQVTGNAGHLGSTPSFAVANNDTLDLNLMYEAA